MSSLMRRTALNSAMKRSALLHGLHGMKQSPGTPTHDDNYDSDVDMSCSSPAASPATSTRSLSPSDMVIESPTSSPASSPLTTTRQLLSNIRIAVPHRDEDDEDQLSSSTSCVEEIINKDLPKSSSTAIPSTHPGLGSRYEVTSTIQESLFGSVHLAIDKVHSRRVAIKISKRALTATGTARSGNPVLENVKNEARMMRDLQGGASSHVVPLLDEIEDDINHYLVSPYYDQGDLYTYLTTLPHTRMTEPEARHTFRQLVEGVSYMHSKGIAHRDLSLENVMLNKGKNGLEAYIIDLGVAAVNPLGPGASTFPCPGARLASEKPGKAMYISPELWAGSDWEAYSNDVFSLGVILYCMLVGRQPFNSSIDVWAQFITSGKWMKLLQHCASGKIHPSSIDAGNYNYWVAAYSHLTPSLLDLISKLLCPIQKRLTLAQILEHPWMKQQ